MFEIISIIAALAVCIMMPIEMGKICKGWVHKKFAGDRARFLAAHRKQLRALMWLGLVVGVSGIGLAAIATRHGEVIVRLISAVVWFSVSGIAFVSRRELANVPETEPVGNSDA
jgi:hypothetical protein